MFGVEHIFGSLVATFLIGILTLLLIYWYATWNHDYWKKRGIHSAKTYPFVGSIGEVFTTAFYAVEDKRYKELGSIYGHFEGNKPVLSVADPKLLREILVKDFPVFINRRVLETGDKILEKVLSVVRGEDWKRIRTIVSPTFSTGKIKRMLSIFKDCSSTLIKNFKSAAEEGKTIDAKRNDFLQLLMDTAKELSEDTKQDAEKEKGDIAANYGESDAGHQMFKNVSSKNLSMDELVAQCVIFFLAGYDTTASTLSFATYELAMNPDVQDTLYEEVHQALKEANGELTYEAIQSMKYLDNVISETLRKYPPAIRLERTADANYKLGETGITITKGMVVTIPVFAMHMDPKFFPDPEKFDPERFSPEERAKRDQYTYLPFGAGPRNCIAMRFALMEVKVCLAHVIANFNVKRSPKTQVPLEIIQGFQGLLQPKEIILELEPRKSLPLEE